MSPSIRWRGRNSASAPLPKRCSSVTSTASLDSLSSSSGGCLGKQRQQHYDVDGNELIDSIGTSISFWDFLQFDSANLQSTSWRNRQMLTLIKSVPSTPVQYIPHFGVDVCFLPERFHYTTMELEPYRKIGDPEMDVVLQYLSMNKNNTNDNNDEVCGCGAFDDVIAYASRQYHKNSEADCPVAQFYKHYYEQTPSWVDYEQLQRGIDVFLAYLPVAGCALFYRSLVGGFSIPQIVEVLRASRYLVPSHFASSTSMGHEMAFQSVKAMQRDRKLAEERLFDTGGFLACCFAPQESTDTVHAPPAASLRPGGPGWEAALRVRVLHAKVRRLLQSKKTGSNGQSTSRWDIDINGTPINQEDMAATLLAFSVNVLVGIEIISGQPLCESEQRDYLALWRYLGWLLGVDTPESTSQVDQPTTSSNASESERLPPIDPCGPRKQTNLNVKCDSNLDLHNDSILHSYATLESMILHLLHPNQSSRELVAHLLNLRSSYMFRSEVCRKLLSEPLSDELGIPQASFQWKGWRLKSFSNIVGHIGLKFVVYFFLLFLRVYTLLTMKYSWFRRRATVRHGCLEKKFLLLWEKSHKQRVTEAASDNRKSTTQSSSPSSSGKKSYCPFSMIMDPNTDK
ncbi:hypothetical protein ACHAWU_004471 [Discostella pseudostelligera]|uniref:ER-bound oxygenase mpaB/mpaB'/Rubber oxygenase catalytic domain-containing protein n=1 Tax=Discostella pseudostelligera TaxID=259834 RepID=A0ABD3M6N1_9STRA